MRLSYYICISGSQYLHLHEKKRAGLVVFEGEGREEIIGSLVEAEALGSMRDLNGRAGLFLPMGKGKTPMLKQGFIKNGELGPSRPIIKGRNYLLMR